MIHIYHLCVIFFPAHSRKEKRHPPMWDGCPSRRRGAVGDYTHTTLLLSKSSNSRLFQCFWKSNLYLDPTSLWNLDQPSKCLFARCRYSDCHQLDSVSYTQTKRTIWKRRIYSRSHRAHIFPCTKKKEKLLSDLSLPPWRSLIYPTCPQ